MKNIIFVATLELEMYSWVLEVSSRVRVLRSAEGWTLSTTPGRTPMWKGRDTFVLLRNINHGFCPLLGCSRRNATNEKTLSYLIKVVSFRSRIKLETHLDCSPLGFNSKFPVSIPDLFTWEIPRPRGCNRKLANYGRKSSCSQGSNSFLRTLNVY